MTNQVQAIIGTVVIVMALMLGTTVVSTITEGEEGTRIHKDEPVLLGQAGQYTKVADGSGFDPTIVNSRGYAVNLTGASDSYVESGRTYEFAEDDTWTVSVWANVDSEASSDSLSAVSANGRVVINYDGSAGNWTAWYYDEGERNSYIVNVTATNQPSNWTNVQVVNNGTHLAIYANNTLGEVEDLSVNKTVDAPTASNWNGRLDELRTFDDALNNTRRQQLVDSPIDPQKATNRTSRVMFDEPNRDTHDIFFTNARLKTYNATSGDGLDGKVMEKKTLINDITGSTDYVWETSGPQIYVVEGGELDGAPVAYVEYDFEGALSSTVGAWSSFTSLAALIPLVIISMLIILRVRGM